MTLLRTFRDKGKKGENDKGCSSASLCDKLSGLFAELLKRVSYKAMHSRNKVLASASHSKLERA